MQKDLTFRRFPRLLTGVETSALSKLLFKEPEFFLTVNGKKGVTHFTFRISVPKDFRRAYAAAFDLFFGHGVDNWERALAKAYWNAKWGKKKVPRLISNILGVVYKDALHRWLVGSLDLLRDDGKKRADLQSYSRAVKARQGPQPEPRFALLVAKRLRVLKPAVKELRNRLRESAHKGNQLLKNEFPNSLSPATLRSALTRLSGLQESEAFRVLLAKGITEQQIVEEYLRCEMPDLVFGPGKPSMDKYIRLGEQLLKDLSRIPSA